MKQSIYSLLTVALLFIASSCKDLDELQDNPNRPTTAPASLVLNGVLNDLYERPWSLEHRQNQFWCCNYNYYGTNEYWASASLNYTTLKNILKMEEEALRLGAAELNPYSALAKFLKAYFYVRMTMRVGDLPLDEALKGLDGATPAYNSQKEIFVQVLKWLEEANKDIAQLRANNNTNLSGDFFYNNDLSKWQKLVNTFTVRVLISLSRQSNDSDLNVKTHFKKIIDNPSVYPLMESIGDNFQYVYNGTSNLYPTNPGNRGFDKGRYNMADTYLGALSQLNDPRAYVVANPAKRRLVMGFRHLTLMLMSVHHPAKVSITCL